MDDRLTLGFFHDMLRIRLIEEAIADRYGEWEMRCPVHLSIGQEGAAVGACAALRPDDYAISGHRSHGHYLAKGGSLKAMLAEIYGKRTGCASGLGGSMHLVDVEAGFLGSTPIVGSGIPIGVGVAYGSMMKGEDKVVLVCFGDGATEAGVFHESLNFAALKRLPVVFFCENNLYSVYSPLSVRQPERQIAAIAAAHGMPALVGDGNDVAGVHGLARRAVDIARSGQGPVFLEVSTYRWREHCGPGYDNHIGYRGEDEFLAWRDRCPLERLKTALLQSGKLDQAAIAAMTADIQAEIDEAFRHAKDSPFPDPAGMADPVMAATHHRLPA